MSTGTCQCGRCKCANSEGNGLVYGKFCECDDRECIDDETGEICTGMYLNECKESDEDCMVLQNIFTECMTSCESNYLQDFTLQIVSTYFRCKNKLSIRFKNE